VTATREHLETAQPAPYPRYPKPATDAQGRRAIEHELNHLHQKAAEIRQAPEQYRPRLVLSDHVRGASILDKIADAANRICGSMYVFLGITIGIVAWLFLGNVVAFDKTPWPLLLTIRKPAEA
jgi:uncharacterized membrane protein